MTHPQKEATVPITDHPSVLPDVPTTPSESSKNAVRSIRTSVRLPPDVDLVYADAENNLHTQPITDLVESGTLTDPVTGDDMEVRGAIVREDVRPLRLDPLEPNHDRLLVTWRIDDIPSYDRSPAAAAARVWRDLTGRTGQPGPDECCVFTVSDPVSGADAEIDISDEQYAHLFD